MPRSPEMSCVVRVSEQGDRGGRALPLARGAARQRQAVGEGPWRAARRALRFEIDVSGRLPLVQAPGAAERRSRWSRPVEADHIVVAYFDRLVRSLKVQLEVIERVERAGGEIFALDHGKLTNGTAAHAVVDEHDGCGVPVLCRGDRREGHGRAGAGGGARCAAATRGSRPGTCAARTACWSWRPQRRRVVRAGVQAPRPGRLAGGDPGVPGRERDRARRSPAWRRCCARGCTSARSTSASCTTRTLTSRSSRIAPCLSACSGGRSRAGARPSHERLLARLGVLRCGTCGSRMVINSDSGNYRCGDTSANRCRRRAAVKADRVEEMVLDAVRAYSATADAHGRASRKQQIREADEAIERANADLDDTIRQLGELGLLGRPASQETLEKLTTALDDAHSCPGPTRRWRARAMSSVLTRSTSCANPRSA